MRPIFSDSRRLTGANVYFDVPAVVLEARFEQANEIALENWREYVLFACTFLAWPTPRFISTRHQKGATLGFTAPLDQLYVATDVNEWAWLKANQTREAFSPAFADIDDDVNAQETLKRAAKSECEPALLAFIEKAKTQNWPVLLDEEFVSIGFGEQTQIWPRQQVPRFETLKLPRKKNLPVAVVTGSNGKTTSVRLLAAMARQAGFSSGHNCTDGLFFNGELIEADDYSGPAGARATLRHAGVQCAILETARGGLLRRGLACTDADVALVTNISEDHFGEYGVFTLSDLAQVKLTVAKSLKENAYLVLNAADENLFRASESIHKNKAWFCADWNHPQLQHALQNGNAVCAVEHAHLCLHADGMMHDLGAIQELPLSFNGVANYNIENMAGAALSAFLLGISIADIRETLQHFGRAHADNPGRLQVWNFNDVTVLMDYAHNPDGIGQFLTIASAMQGEARLAVLLGQAGNRENDDIVKLAETVAQFEPDFVVLKDLRGYERGREPGEVPAILHSVLQQNGIGFENIQTHLDEIVAVRNILAWAKPGDVLALPVHGLAERHAVQSLLDLMRAQQWQSQQTVPELPELNGIQPLH